MMFFLCRQGNNIRGITSGDLINYNRYNDNKLERWHECTETFYMSRWWIKTFNWL